MTTFPLSIKESDNWKFVLHQIYEGAIRDIHLIWVPHQFLLPLRWRSSFPSGAFQFKGRFNFLPIYVSPTSPILILPTIHAMRGTNNEKNKLHLYFPLENIFQGKSSSIENNFHPTKWSLVSFPIKLIMRRSA